MFPTKKTKVVADVEYVCGHLRRGHFELHLTPEELIAFKAKTKEEQEEDLRDGQFIVDETEVDDVGPLEDIRYE